MSAHLNFAIETARLRLRAWRADDFPAFAQLNADAQVMRYFPSPLTQTRKRCPCANVSAIHQSK